MLTVDLPFLELKPGDRFLDLGCGEGRHLHAAYFAAPVLAVGVDLKFEDVARTRAGLAEIGALEAEGGRAAGLAVGNALALPFPDGAFDKIVCSEVLEHIPDYRAALAEIHRVLRPGGLLAVSVPRYWPEWVCWRLSDQYPNQPGGHVRIFRPAEIRGAIEATGQRFLRRHWAHALHSPYWWLKCLWWEHRDTAFLIRQYHRLLVWDILKRPWITRTVERLANPLMGKSLVLYFRKEGPA